MTTTYDFGPLVALFSSITTTHKTVSGAWVGFTLEDARRALKNESIAVGAIEALRAANLLTTELCEVSPGYRLAIHTLTAAVPASQVH